MKLWIVNITTRFALDEDEEQSSYLVPADSEQDARKTFYDEMVHVLEVCHELRIDSISETQGKIFLTKPQRLLSTQELERFDPIRDEDKEFGLESWAKTLINEVRLYVTEQKKEQNAYHLAKHKWAEWMGTFARYMSW